MSDLRAPVVPGVTGLEVIGRGGFGVVYRGRQEDLSRDVAIKVLSAPGADARAVELWRREVTAMGRLSNHPNIVPVYAAGLTEDGLPYLMMPFVAGGSLHDRVNASGPLSSSEAARVGAKLANGLGAAHQAGVLHRDLKPANVLLTQYGEPQLSDFGIARLVDTATTTTGSVRATIGYAAPEVLSGDPATPAADVYGLGATLHAALSGRAPFAGTDAGEPMVARVGRVLTQPPPDLRPLGVDPALAAVVDACLAKDPADRPASAAALQARLEALASGSTPPPPPPPPPTAVAPVLVPPPPPVVVPPPERTSVLPPVAPASGPTPSRGRGVLVALLLLVVFALAAGVAWALTRDSGDDVVTGDETTTEPATTEPTTTAPPDTTPSTTSTTTEPETTTTTTEPETTTTTTEPETTTTTAPEADAPTDSALAGAATTYYDTVRAGDLDGSWALLTARFQQESGGREAYDRYWTETIASVEVQGPPRGSAEEMTASLTLRYETGSGRTTREDVVLTFVQADDGRLLIDDYVTGGGR